MPQKQCGCIKNTQLFKHRTTRGFGVKLRHKDEVGRCRFFVVVDHGSVLLGMMDIELLDILKITFEVVEDQQAEQDI